MRRVSWSPPLISTTKRLNQAVEPSFYDSLYRLRWPRRYVEDDSGRSLV